MIELENDKQITNAIKIVCEIINAVMFLYGVVEFTVQHISLAWLFFLIFVSMLNTFLIIFLGKRYSVEKNKVETYRHLVGDEYPLYGIANYISTKEDNHNQSRNNDLELTELQLHIKLKNPANNKHNDMQVCWILIGTNKNKGKKLDKVYLRVGGDSSTDFQQLQLLAKELKQNRDVIVRRENNNSSATSNSLELTLPSPVEYSKEVQVRVQYIWPQCFNPLFDYLLIDPNNFGARIKKMKVFVYCDNVIIKPTTRVSLHHINMKKYEEGSNGSFAYDPKKHFFSFEETNIDQRCIYFTKISC